MTPTTASVQRWGGFPPLLGRAADTQGWAALRTYITTNMYMAQFKVCRHLVEILCNYKSTQCILQNL